MGVVEPGGALVVEVGEGALLEIGFGDRELFDLKGFAEIAEVLLCRGTLG